MKSESNSTSFQVFASLFRWISSRCKNACGPQLLIGSNRHEAHTKNSNSGQGGNLNQTSSWAETGPGGTTFSPSGIFAKIIPENLCFTAEMLYFCARLFQKQ